LTRNTDRPVGPKRGSKTPASFWPVGYPIFEMSEREQHDWARFGKWDI
jgi:hypothetical protein